MNIQFDNTKHSGPCGMKFHKITNYKHNKSDKHLLFTGKKTKCERCKIYKLLLKMNNI